MAASFDRDHFRLDFGYDKNEETKGLHNLLEKDEPPSEAYYSQLLEHRHKAELDMKAIIAPASSELGGAVEALSTSKSTFLNVISSSALESDFADKCDMKPKEESDTDSDDEDLEPYDMSNHLQYKKVRIQYCRDNDWVNGTFIICSWRLHHTSETAWRAY